MTQTHCLWDKVILTPVKPGAAKPSPLPCTSAPLWLSRLCIAGMLALQVFATANQVPRSRSFIKLSVKPATNRAALLAAMLSMYTEQCQLYMSFSTKPAWVPRRCTADDDE